MSQVVKPAPAIERGELPELTTRAAFDAKTFDRAKRTIEVVWSTGQRGRRYGWNEPYQEELSLAAEHVRMGFLNSGRAPVLNNHARWDGIRGILGVVDRAWLVSDTEARALLRFSGRAELEPILQDLEDGIIVNVSGGYRVYRYQDVTEPNEKERVLRAIDWEPREISLVDIPFEDGAHTRSAPQAEKHPVTICRSAAPRSMEEELDDQGNPIPPPAAGAQTRSDVDPPEAAAPSAVVPRRPAPGGGAAADEIRAEATRAERQRVRAIDELCAKYAGRPGIDQVRRDAHERGWAMDQVRSAVLDALAAEDDRTHTSSHVRVGVEQRDKVRAAATHALLFRLDPMAHPLDKVQGANDFAYGSLLDLARSCVGVGARGISKQDLVTRALMSTSDFPRILGDVANKRLLQTYQAAEKTFGQFTRVTTNPDFKPARRVRLGDAPPLALVRETGAIQRSGMGENQETLQLSTFARIVGLTRQAIINDDLAAFDNMVAAMAVRVSELESDIVWGIVIDSPTMSDGVALYHAASHGNQIANVLGIPGLSAGRRAMRLHRGIGDGPHAGTRINITPRVLAVPPTLETEAEQLTRLPIVPGQTTHANPFQGSLIPVVEPRLEAISGTCWFLFADQSSPAYAIEAAYLDGQMGPAFDRREGFDIDGVEFKVRHDFGAAAIDYRGTVKSTGGG